MKKYFIMLAMLVFVAAISSCASGHKDCQGHRHHVKTDMGGYL